MTGEESDPYEPPEVEDLETARQRRAREKLADARRLLAAAQPYKLKGEE